MKVIITGSTGMVGRGVLLECLEDDQIESVLLLNRNPTEVKHSKIKEILVKDFFDWTGFLEQLKGYQACFFCLGISSVGMSEEAYSRITYDLTLALAKPLRELNQEMVFIYVSGTGTDSSEKGRIMWARVKGRTENALFALGFKAMFAFRPGLIIPEKGIRSRTKLYQAVYILLRPFFPLLKRMSSVTSTSRIGRAMISLAKNPQPPYYLENREINAVSE
ncbi:MAG TPA: NAD-dependent epimerase/dehydratase family protein [Chitinophagaceae bacterium]|nr:NAD-dependent epimerase/dehydratase family protein [Chitinophagaceae bacterium]